MLNHVCGTFVSSVQATWFPASGFSGIRRVRAAFPVCLYEEGLPRIVLGGLEKFTKEDRRTPKGWWQVFPDELRIARGVMWAENGKPFAPPL